MLIDLKTTNDHSETLYDASFTAEVDSTYKDKDNESDSGKDDEEEELNLNNSNINLNRANEQNNK